MKRAMLSHRVLRATLPLALCGFVQTSAAQQPWLSPVPPHVAGLDSPALAAAVQLMEANPEARAILVARDNQLVLERYFRGFTGDSSWNIKSVSKTVQSALTGIALHKGLFKSLDQRFSEIMPERFLLLPPDRDISFRSLLKRSDSLRRRVTLRDALTLRSGLAGEDMDLTYVLSFIHARDVTRFVLELPMDAVPGTRFRYNSGNTTLLNAALETVTHMSPARFAHEELFEPIGGAVRRWSTDVSGLPTGGAELYLTARDMLRFGLLYLNHGRAGDRQVVPRAWVDSSLTQYVSFSRPPADSAARMLPGAVGYGLLWWHRESAGHRMSCAWGYGGQFVCLVPELDIAIVVMSTREGNRPAYYADVFAAIDGIVEAADP